MMLILLSCVVPFVVAVSPPSQFNTECKFMTVVGQNTDTWPIDVCYRTAIDEFIGSRSFKWLCTFDNATNSTFPVHYRYRDLSCNLLQYVESGDVTPVNAYNCDSDILCPVGTVYEYNTWNLTQFYNPYCRNGTTTITNTTVLNATPEPMDDVFSFSYVLNVCNNRSVFTCDNSHIYQWNYNDNDCQNFKDYQIFRQTSYECVDYKKFNITECDMEDVIDPFAPTRAPTKQPTKAPTKQPTAPPDASDIAHMFPYILNFVALLTVSVFMLLRSIIN